MLKELGSKWWNVVADQLIWRIVPHDIIITKCAMQQQVWWLIILKDSTFEITTTAWSTILSINKDHCWAILIETSFAKGVSIPWMYGLLWQLIFVILYTILQSHLLGLL